MPRPHPLVAQFHGRRRREAGLSALGYLGLAIVAALVLGLIALTVLNATPRLRQSVCEITHPTSAASCAEQQTTQSSAPGGVVTLAAGGFWEDLGRNLCYITQPLTGARCDPPHGDWKPGGFGSEGPDPGQNVQLPQGLDRQSKLAQELMKTERGRRLLQWLHDHNVRVQVDENETGAYYDPVHHVIVMHPDYDNVSTVVHETSHAMWQDKNGTPPITLPKDDYVARYIDDETHAVWLEVINAKEQRASGQNPLRSDAEKEYDSAFNKAYDQAINGGQSATEAAAAGDRAGVEAIRTMFTSGKFRTSTTRETYPEYYGRFWKSQNCSAGSTKPGC